jgi:hypothetical protein
MLGNYALVVPVYNHTKMHYDTQNLWRGSFCLVADIDLITLCRGVITFLNLSNCQYSG